MKKWIPAASSPSSSFDWKALAASIGPTQSMTGTHQTRAAVQRVVADGGDLKKGKAVFPGNRSVKQSDIVVGAKYANPKHGGQRIVDAIFFRATAEQVLHWTNAQAPRLKGRRNGLCNLAAFARWAHTREPMSYRERQAYELRSAQLAWRTARYGAPVDLLTERPNVDRHPNVVVQCNLIGQPATNVASPCRP
jgi:hypothetical protein